MLAKRILPILVFGFSLAASGAFAASTESFVGKSLKTPPSGQPFCAERERLREYLMAMLSGDKKWAMQVDGCAMISPGLKVVVLDEEAAEADAPFRVLQVRAFGTKGSMVGYTISVGLVGN